MRNGGCTRISAKHTHKRAGIACRSDLPGRSFIASVLGHITIIPHTVTARFRDIAELCQKLFSRACDLQAVRLAPAVSKSALRVSAAGQHKVAALVASTNGIHMHVRIHTQQKWSDKGIVGCRIAASVGARAARFLKLLRGHSGLSPWMTLAARQHFRCSNRQASRPGSIGCYCVALSPVMDRSAVREHSWVSHLLVRGLVQCGHGNLRAPCAVATSCMAPVHAGPLSPIPVAKLVARLGEGPRLRASSTTSGTPVCSFV